MPINDQRDDRIEFLNIDSESNYFNTQEQIRIKKTRWFKETASPAMLSGSNSIVGLLSRVSVAKDDALYNSPVHLTSSTVVDNAGGSRPILSLSVDYYASSSYDSFRNGIEITQDKHWVAGMSKITAGTPGHLFDSMRFGQPDTSIVSEDEFVEIDTFDPILYVKTGGDPAFTTFPIVTGDSNQVENYILNGIIEPFPIRPVISNFSINFPFEPHSTRGEFGNGNMDSWGGSSQVVGLDEYVASPTNYTPFLDAVDLIGLGDGSGFFVGPTLGYLSLDKNHVPPFEDFVYPRGEPLSSSYGEQMSNAINSFPTLETTYVSRKQRSSCTGFTYDNAPQGTDSIAYGGLLY